MRRVLRYIFRGLIGVVALVGSLGARFGYSGYSPAPEVPQLSGTLTPGDYDGGRTESDVPDLRASGNGKWSAARGGDAPSGRERRADSNRDGLRI
jgi:hypothetical protein